MCVCLKFYQTENSNEILIIQINGHSECFCKQHVFVLLGYGVLPRGAAAAGHSWPASPRIPQPGRPASSGPSKLRAQER